MSKEVNDKKPRVLRRPPVSVRERAAKGQQPKPSRRSRLAPVAKIFKPLGGLKGLAIWRPFITAGRFIGKYLIPPYIRSSFAELRQVEWPNRILTLKLTWAVLVFALVFGVIIAAEDSGLDKLFKQVLLR